MSWFIINYMWGLLLAYYFRLSYCLLRFSLPLICLYCHLYPWYVIFLPCFRFISISFISRVVALWYKVQLQDKTQLLFTLLWCLPVGSGSSLRFIPLDKSMDMVGRDCLWMLTIFLTSQLAQIFIWLISIMVHISDVAFLSGSDEDHFGSTSGKHLRGKPNSSLADSLQKVLNGKERGMQMIKVFDKWKISRLAEREPYELNGCLRVQSYLGQYRIGQKRIPFLFGYVDAIYYSFYVIVMFWKELGLAYFGTHYTSCYSWLYCISPFRTTTILGPGVRKAFLCCFRSLLLYVVFME